LNHRDFKNLSLIGSEVGGIALRGLCVLIPWRFVEGFVEERSIRLAMGLDMMQGNLFACRGRSCQRPDRNSDQHGAENGGDRQFWLLIRHTPQPPTL
jgi:hypothetical protein